MFILQPGPICQFGMYETEIYIATDAVQPYITIEYRGKDKWGGEKLISF